MRTVLLAALLVAGAFGAWWFFLREAPQGIAEDDPDSIARDGSAEPSPNGLRAADRPDVPNPWPPPPREDRDATWRLAEFTIAPGPGPVTGRDVEQAVEKAGVVQLRPREPADREALEAARIEMLERGSPIHHERLLPILTEAGFEAEPRYPEVWYRRRPGPTPVPEPIDRPR